MTLEERHWTLIEQKGSRSQSLRTILDRYERLMSTHGYDLAQKWSQPAVSKLVRELRKGNLGATGRQLDIELANAMQRALGKDWPEERIRQALAELTDYEKEYLVDAAENTG